MTIITADGKTIQFAGDDNVVVDRRVAERRQFDHNVPEQREADRRAPAPPEPRKSIQERYDERVSRHLQLWMEDLLTRIELQCSMNHTVINQDGTKEEVNVEQSRSASAGR
jgi:hypothetical protein